MSTNSYFSTLILAMAALSLGGCSDVDNNLPASGDLQQVTFSASVPRSLHSRAGSEVTFGQGSNIDKLTYAVYEPGNDEPVVCSKGETTVADGKVQVSFRLAKGKTYEFIFFAYSSSCSSVYTFDETTKELTVDYDGVTSNDDSRDAFFAAKTVTISGATETVTLTRPFAQLNVGTNDFEQAGIDPASNSVTTSVAISVPTTLNLSTGDVSGSTEVTFAAAAPAASEAFPGSESTEYLAMNYILLGEKQLSTVNVVISDGANVLASPKFENVPLQRNFRTNISGYLLTDETAFDITVEAAFEGTENGGDQAGDEGENADPNVPKSRMADDGTKIYQVESASDLVWIGEQSSADESFWQTNSFELTGNVDFTATSRAATNVWTPIDIKNPGREFTINGNGHTVRGYTFAADGTDNVGLFGRVDGVEITGFKVEDVEFASQTGNNVGALIGSTTGRVRNCEATNVNIRVTNGANIGGIVGVVSGITSDYNDDILRTLVVKRSSIMGAESVGAVAGQFDNQTLSRSIGDIFFIVDDQNITNTTVSSSDAKPGLLAGTTTDRQRAVFYKTVSQSGNSTENLLGDGAIEQATVLLGNVKFVNGAYEVYTMPHLVQAFAKVGAGQKISLMADIDGHEATIAPIVVNDLDGEFIFEGNGHTISNYTIRNSSDGVAALLVEGSKSSATFIKNLTIQNLNFDNIHVISDLSNASIVIDKFGGKMTGVKVANSSIESAAAATGILAGSASDGVRFTNCAVDKCDITAPGSIGLMVGNLFGRSTNTKSHYYFIECAVSQSVATCTESSRSQQIGVVFGMQTYSTVYVINLVNEGNTPSAEHVRAYDKNNYKYVIENDLP